ncbi:MAG: trypsin-like peptidase domain-containing protein [Phycisphaerae bacterium]|nr:trypsin-like peptidase domain-containing protein [Phycisphaerae bacterium]
MRNTTDRCRSKIAAIFLTAILVCTGGVFAQPSAKEAASAKARRTPLVKLVERVAESVVDITTIKPIGNGRAVINHGTGSILHETGYVITNNHVVSHAARSQVALSNGKVYPYRIVAKLPYEDLALIKIDAKESLRPVRLGRSNDLMLGEDVLAVGNSHGLGHTVTPGIVSGLNRPTGPAAASLQTGMIQTNAAVNPGNSGGPLFNALGEMIGVITLKATGENISFAIAVDRLREVFPELMSIEQRYGFVLGMEVDTLGKAVKVTRVAKGSPAQIAGVRAGDEVIGAGKMTIHQGLDFYLSLIGQKVGRQFPLKLRRSGKHVNAIAKLGKFIVPPPLKADGLNKGVHFSAYAGSWDKLPDFDKIKPVAAGISNKFSHAVLANMKDNFALKFTGLVKVPADGLYVFYTSSDDGSRLYIGEKLVVDNDGLHGVMEMGGLIRLSKGLYPITVTFFEKTGGEELKVFFEGPGLPKREIPPAALFHRPPAKPAKTPTSRPGKDPSSAPAKNLSMLWR